MFENEDFAFGAMEADTVDEELREWKRTRRKSFRLPWRQISFMASVCFGIGSFVLPDSVDQTVQWLLLALAALGLIASLSARRKFFNWRKSNSSGQ